MLPPSLPGPWKGPRYLHVGGLTDVGFGADSDLLLALSHAGRGLFDCLTSARIARDDDDAFPFDQGRQLAVGIGPLADRRVRTAGLFGGALDACTADGWRVAIAPGEVVDVFAPNNRQACATFRDFITTFRAAGFSPTGRSMIVATSSEVTLYTR